uniref:Uncharacterized protein n=1 Tax=Arundo donax TaxID=35708 RepID=A0A0A9D9H1_ARUDO
MKQLYQQGARRIAILGLPPIGCVPSQRTVAGGLASNCDPARNSAAQLFNSKLKEEIKCLQKELQCQRIGYVDIYDVLQDMITTPCNYGFDVSSRGCCGTGDFEVSILCNQLTATTCPDDRTYVFWDSFHPTERAYEIMVDYLYPRYVEKLLSYYEGLVLMMTSLAADLLLVIPSLPNVYDYEVAISSVVTI